MSRALIILRTIEAIIATAAYGVVAGLLIVDIVGREIFGRSFLGADQLAVFGAIIAGFLGLTLATSDNAHLRPAFMDFVLGKHATLAVRLGDAIPAFFFLGAALVAWSFVAFSMDAQDKAPVFYFVLWPLQIILPYAFASSGPKHAIFAWRPAPKPIADGVH